MDTSDVCLFDEDFFEGNKIIHESSVTGGDDHRRENHIGRRPYNAVPEEVKLAPEYAIRRQRNNFAVKRCRTLTKSKQKSFEIKASGYRSLMLEYRKETKQVNARRKNLESFFRQYLLESSRPNSTGSSASASHYLQETISAEELNRQAFEDKLAEVRQQYVDRLREANVPEASSPLPVTNSSIYSPR